MIHQPLAATRDRGRGDRQLPCRPEARWKRFDLASSRWASKGASRVSCRRPCCSSVTTLRQTCIPQLLSCLVSHQGNYRSNWKIPCRSCPPPARNLANAVRRKIFRKKKEARFATGTSFKFLEVEAKFSYYSPKNDGRELILDQWFLTFLWPCSIKQHPRGT